MSRGSFRTVLATTAFAAVSTAIVAPVHAQGDEDAKEEAAKLYKEGVDSYFAADYGVAITKFREGFELDPNAMFLYNLSLCFSKLGNFEEALAHAERAQEMGGMPDEATTKNKARLEAFAVLVTTEESAVAIEEQQAQAASGITTCATNDDCAENEVCNVRRGVCVESLAPEEPGEPLFSPIGWAGVGVGGLGIGLLTAATITSISLGPDIKEHDRLLNDDDPSNDGDAEELADSLTRRQNRGKIFLFTGLAATLVGGGLVVVDLFVLEDEGAETNPGTVFAPVLYPSGAGFSFTTRF